MNNCFNGILVFITHLKVFDIFSHLSGVDIGVTSDGKTIVCHHPTVDVPYELTQVRGCF